MRIRKPTGEAPLTPAVAAVLLGGWSARPLGGVPESDDDGLWDLFAERDEGIVRRWQEHEAWLRGEAARLGIEPEYRAADGRMVFFGEHVREEIRRWGR